MRSSCGKDCWLSLKCLAKDENGQKDSELRRVGKASLLKVKGDELRTSSETPRGREM